MKLDGRDAACVQLAGQRLRTVLGAREDHRATRRGCQVDEDGHPVVTVHVQHMVVHRGDRRLRRVSLVGRRVVQVALDEHVDTRVERRREQHPLAAAGGRVEQATDGGQEAEVCHVVGLVEHGDLDLGEVAGALLDQVLEATGTGDEDVDAGAERLHLRVLADAAEDGAGLETVHLGQRRECCVDLRDQLAGRRQDQGARALRDDVSGTRRDGLPAAAGTRWSCRSRCGHDQGRHDHRASRGASRPGWE